MPTDKAITELDNAVTLTGAEQFVMSQSGTTVRAPGQDDTLAQPDLFSLFNPGNVRVAQLTITAVQVVLLNATPLDIVDPPGAGFSIEVISATAELQFNAAAYTTNGILELITDTATDAQVAMPNTSFVFGTVNKLIKFAENNPSAVTDTQIIENQQLQVQMRTGEAAVGDSPIIVRVLYRIIAI